MLFISHVVDKAHLQLNVRQSLLAFMVQDIEYAYNKTVEFLCKYEWNKWWQGEKTGIVFHITTALGTNIKKTILKD